MRSLKVLLIRSNLKNIPLKEHMLNFIKNLSLEYQCLLISTSFLVFLSTISFVRYKVFMYNLNQDNIPPIIRDFPDYDTSPSAYLETKNRLENFLSLTLTGQEVELKLSENDINNLYTKGIILNKHEQGNYLYYSIKENSILKTKIEWPFF